ncbi:magnesium transporter CorA family protein [candidate division KSB1 bacterium]|nr:magnesium transporter CorA family protein [candidate division KSB1 bacterium]
MLRSYQILAERIVECSDDHAPILLYINPDETEKHDLIDRYNVDQHTLNSALDPDELSRLEFESNHMALIFKNPKNYSGEEKLVFRVASTGIFLFCDRIIIVVLEDTQIFGGKQFLKVNSLSDVVLKLVYRSIFHFLEHLKIINFLSDELETKINASMDNRHIINLFALEKSLVYYLNSITSNSVLIEKLKNNATKIGLIHEQVEFLDDLMIENSQCYKQAEIYSNILASLMDARASIVGNNLNVLMKTLNVITIGIMVPTFVVSAFSMNVAIPMQHWRFAFWFIMGLAAVSVAAFMVVWKFLKW